MRVFVGLGLHRRLTAAERAPLRGFDIVEHDPDDVVPTAQLDGIPGSLFRPAAACQALVTVGICELHQYAGLSGGHKGVAVGLGGRETLAALHHRDRVLDPGVRLGAVRGNPFRAAIDALGEAAGCGLALNLVAGTRTWLGGPPRAVVAEAAERLDPWLPVDVLAEGAVLRVPAAKGQSLYQASRAATYLGLSPAPPLRPGATLYLDAPCPEGLGAEAGFVAALQAHAPPWSGLLVGPPPTGAGAQRAVILAVLAQRFRLALVGVDDPAPFEAVGIPARRGPAPVGLLEVSQPFLRLPQARPPADR